MPLSGSTLGDEIRVAVAAITFQAPDIMSGESASAYRARLQGLLASNAELTWDAIAGAIVDHITANAVATGTCPPGTAGGPLTLGRVT